MLVFIVKELKNNLDVLIFLKKIKKIINEDPSKLDWIPTSKNRRTRQELGLTIQDIEDNIRNLEEKDLFRGPERDRDIPNELLYIFKKELGNQIIYIKLKLRDNKIVVCLSFHIDE